MTGLLMVVVLFLAVFAAAQIMRIYELSAKARQEREYEVTDKDNNTQGRYMLLFGIGLLVSLVWMMMTWGEIMLPKPSSLHGVEIDRLWDISMGLIIFMFFLVQPVLFYFAYKYRGRKDNQATYYEHNNRLEFIWTIVPAIALAVLIIYGLTTWSNVMNPESEEEPMVVELYAQQFKWTARYSGADNTLGFANVRLIGGANTVGVDTTHANSADDFLATEIHLPVGRPVLFKFRSQDVIHSAYMPHFRAQMNCVPGMETHFQFTPTVTTAEIRQDADVQGKVERINAIRQAKGLELYNYDYILLCNKICGSAHYNMQMNIVVETQAEYDAWANAQKTIAETL
jgi:cytochrome c oxidase subunit 2